jgi:hypothetical protein
VDTEAWQVLVDRAQRRFGPLAGEVVAEAVCNHNPGADLAVLEAALAAARRRFDSAKSDAFVVRRAGRGPLGTA